MSHSADPKLALQMKADLDNVADILPNGDDFRWHLKVRCDNCGEESKNFIYFTSMDCCPLKGGRGHASVVMKCKLCSRENSLDIIKDSIASYCMEDAETYKVIIAFDFRGISPTEFSPRNGWNIRGLNSNTLFSDVDLSEKEWFDYDETSANVISVTGITFQFINVK